MRECADFQKCSAMRRYIDDGADVSDAEVTAWMDRYYATAARLACTPATTQAAIRAKAEALHRLLDQEDALGPMPTTSLARSLVNDLLRVN